MSAIIKIGDVNNPSYQFDGDSIMSIICNTTTDILGDELSIDNLTVQVLCNDINIKDVPYAAEIRYYIDGALNGLFYVKEIKRIAVTTYEIMAYSLIGILDKEKYYGGIYTGKTLQSLITDIIRTDGLQKLKVCDRMNISKQHNAQGYIMGYAVGPGNSHYNIRNKMSFHFVFNGTLTPSYPSGTLNYESCILGGVTFSDSDSDMIPLNYGVYASCTRSSTSSSFPQSANLTFKYRDYSFSLGTVSVGSEFEIVCIPAEGKVTINGTDYSISAPSKESSYTTYTDYVGGGQEIYKSNGSVRAKGSISNIKMILYSYKIETEDGETVIEMLPLYNTENNNLWVRGWDEGYQLYTPTCDISGVTFVSGKNAPGVVNEAYRTDIISNMIFENAVGGFQIYGWLPILSKREALHHILFSTGVILKKSNNGALVFSAPSNYSESEILSDNIYQSGSIEYLDYVNRIDITDHEFTVDTSTSTITDVPIIAVGDPDSGVQVLELDSPSELYPIDNIGSINYAMNSGIYCACENAILARPMYHTAVGTEFRGYIYSHSKIVLTNEIGNYADGKTVSITDVALINVRNINNIMDRMKAYYMNAYKAKIGIVKTAEKCGYKYNFTNPFEEQDSGFLVKIGDHISSIAKAECEFICGYIAPSIGQEYNNYIILTESGTWEVPQSVFEKENPRIHVILIGGGQGGESGYAGANGYVTQQGSGSIVATGGNGGAWGTPGKVNEFTINNPQSSYDYSCGSGGAGGAICDRTASNNSGSNGTDTSLTDGSNTYSSSSGSVLDSGFINIFTGVLYAAKNVDNYWNTTVGGVPHGKGGNGGYIVNSDNYVNFYDGQYEIVDNTVYFPGAHGNYYMLSDGFATTGGAGGGAAAGSNGSNGTDGQSDKSGNGGAGGNATYVPPKEVYGNGGHGGYGGGAGGCSGDISVNVTASTGAGGTGGYGGKGGDGGDGCIIIYY